MLENINSLVNSRKSENINLAVQLCIGQGISFEELDSVARFVPFFKWLNNSLCLLMMMFRTSLSSFQILKH